LNFILFCPQQKSHLKHLLLLEKKEKREEEIEKLTTTFVRELVDLPQIIRDSNDPLKNPHLRINQNLFVMQRYNQIEKLDKEYFEQLS
jgi:hypothetical protein